MIRTRIAPSPTGYMHIGTARTALFNYLFAKKHHGQFLVRIEDTDVERSQKEYEENILNGIKWLGLNWDEEIVRQSERGNIYRPYLEKLISEGKAGWCSSEKKNVETDNNFKVHRCEEHGGFNKERGGIIRFKVPKKSPIYLKDLPRVVTEKPEDWVPFDDLIRGRITTPLSIIENFAIAKDLDTPLYNFSVVIDDHEMKITHVIRGEDHISNTPKQILIQETLGLEKPEYAHVPLILAPDRSKLSKRHGAVALSEFKNLGYLPQAMINFLTLLGWHPETNQEIFSLGELTKEFDFGRVQKAGAVFDAVKLDSINNHYIKQMAPADVAGHLKPHLADYNPTLDKLIKIAHLFQSRLQRFSEVKDLAGFIFNQPEYPSQLLAWKDAPPKKTKDNLETVLMVLEKLDSNSFNIDSTTTEIMPIANKLGRGEVLWPLRVALTGLEKSPGPFEVMEVLGREESLERIKRALGKLK